MIVRLLSRQDTVKTLTDSKGMVADHVMSATAFTYQAIARDGSQAEAARLGFIVVADRATAEEPQISGDAMPHIINKLTAQFRDALVCLFGEDMLRAAMLVGLADMVGALPADDDPAQKQFPLN